jgi:hypothetical protein
MRSVNEKTNKMVDDILSREIENNLPLAEKIYKALSIKGSNPKAIAFMITALPIIYRDSFDQKFFEGVITDGKGDGNFDAIYIHGKYVDIFDFSGKEPKAPDMIILKRSLEDNIFCKPKNYNEFNERLRTKLKEIHRRKKNIIRLFIVRKSNWLDGGRTMRELQEFIRRSNKGEFYYFNTRKLIEKFIEPKDYPLEWNCKFDSSWKYTSSSQEEAILKISVCELLKLQDKCSKEGLDLFNKNVRAFLNNKNLKNEIGETIAELPGKFHIYHNGIVIATPEKIKFTTSSKVIIKRPQIINGAQTINSLYEIYKDDLKNRNLKEAKIICKIVTADMELTNKICETSNTQIPIKPWDLRANDNIQLYLEKIINNIGYSYIRKGVLRVKGKKIILMPKFIQWVYSAEFGKPAEAKNKKRILFSVVLGEYQKISKRLENIGIKKIKKICEIGTYIEEQIKKAKKDERGLLRDADFHILAVMYLKNIPLKESRFNKVVAKIKEHIKERRKDEPEITHNKIFTKSDELFKFLMKKV